MMEHLHLFHATVSYILVERRQSLKLGKSPNLRTNGLSEQRFGLCEVEKTDLFYLLVTCTP